MTAVTSTRPHDPIAVSHYVRALALQWLVTSAGRGIDDALIAVRTRAALVADDPDVAELASLLKQAEAVVEKLTRKLPEGW